MKPSPEILQPTDPLPPKPVVQLTASLQLPNGLTMEVPITIDSGSNADFIGLDFLQEHNIALLPATLPLKVVTVDGRELLGAGGAANASDGDANWESPRSHQLQCHPTVGHAYSIRHELAAQAQPSIGVVPATTDLRLLILCGTLHSA
ncbi:Hypothetical predicted protein [Podarcis lilfordi]|uniref:Uncharacterized protein n=2 Tax=Podarcis lilfordi TaxID=74358 RepID=A0AA35VPQ7_9SAUR|nr:Hypothetical predicted protein [Podarcis lilfordi]CAI5764641.1 Hypothetical predicted protein [Podarcis lilfordi]CAI5767149.1 Hypothetical predicted protein [Podarcis lilfordi]CAI5780145.1 Hypothetical predicted protein [Podarcis lilfordi]CAI5780284.1 Hypothetical predicted protein [Podarcis lilfordi]